MPRKTKENESAGAVAESPADKTKKLKPPLIVLESSGASGSEFTSENGTHGLNSPSKVRSPNKNMKLSLSTTAREETKISGTDSLPEVR